MEFKIDKKEKETGKARALKITQINGSISFQEILLKADGTTLMKGEVQLFAMGNFPAPGAEIDEAEQKARAIFEKEVAEAFASFYNKTIK